jgi:hypothetical protein
MVIAVQSETLNIQDAHGDVTVLKIARDAELRGVASIDVLVAGQHVMARGAFADNGDFVVDRLRLIEGPDRP